MEGQWLLALELFDTLDLTGRARLGWKLWLLSMSEMLLVEADQLWWGLMGDHLNKLGMVQNLF
jgi:hypothetical protein